MQGSQDGRTGRAPRSRGRRLGSMLFWPNMYLYHPRYHTIEIDTPLSISGIDWQTEPYGSQWLEWKMRFWRSRRSSTGHGNA